MVKVVCALIVRDHRVLLAQRPEGKHLALKWEFPGGKVEPGEAPESAIVREIQEELGCEIQVTAALPTSTHVYERGPIEMIPFICHLTHNSPEPTAHEHAGLAWAMPDKISSYDLAPADWPVVKVYLEWLNE